MLFYGASTPGLTSPLLLRALIMVGLRSLSEQPFLRLVQIHYVIFVEGVMLPSPHALRHIIRNLRNQGI